MKGTVPALRTGSHDGYSKNLGPDSLTSMRRESLRCSTERLEEDEAQALWDLAKIKRTTTVEYDAFRRP